MSTSRYSIFNFNNSNYSGSWFKNLPTFKSDKHLLPMYAVNNTQLMTYVLIGITTVTLGYITLSENEEEEEERETREKEREQREKEQAQIAQQPPAPVETPSPTTTTGGKHQKTKYNKPKPHKRTQRK
jgi:hypothetical protein